MKRKKNSESGMALILVSVFIMVISMVVLGILSRSVSQALSVENQYKRIQAEQLSRGLWWRAHGTLRTGGALATVSTAMPPAAQTGGTAYVVTYQATANDARGNQGVKVKVSY